MSKKVTIEFFGVTASGKTVTEAKQNAARRAELIVKNAGGSSWIFCWRGWIGIVSPYFNDWGYIYFQPKDGLNREYHSLSNGYTMESAINRLICNIVQLAWLPEDGVEPPAEMTDEKDRSEFRGWARWQLFYRYWEGLGESPEVCFTKASQYWQYADTPEELK